MWGNRIGVGVQDAVPERLDIRPKGRDAIGAQTVEMARAEVAYVDESGLAEGGQMLGYRRLRDGYRGGQLTDGTLSCAQFLENGATGAISQGFDRNRITIH
jgi:hypothetical protein